MNHTTTNKSVPVIAILAPNTLMGLGLQSILQRMLPFAAFRLYDDFSQIEQTTPEELFHIFVMANIVVEHSEFFNERRSKTIVLTNGTPLANVVEGYHQINISAPHSEIESALQNLHGAAHGMRSGGSTPAPDKEILTSREIEVLQLIVEGLLNKEIAARLNIGITTVISHRKNIVEKLGVKSVAGLTIYAVMKRYVVI